MILYWLNFIFDRSRNEQRIKSIQLDELLLKMGQRSCMKENRRRKERLLESWRLRPVWCLGWLCWHWVSHSVYEAPCDQPILELSFEPCDTSEEKNHHIAVVVAAVGIAAWAHLYTPACELVWGCSDSWAYQRCCIVSWAPSWGSSCISAEESWCIPLLLHLDKHSFSCEQHWGIVEGWGCHSQEGQRLHPYFCEYH